jgi:hypothetical protein
MLKRFCERQSGTSSRASNNAAADVGGEPQISRVSQFVLRGVGLGHKNYPLIAAR